ncbi:MAG: hypothetical protein HY854_08005 [Burkholderiales bacterium]|nr:hypothetical protein [Burkholderiales bacterium]
MGRPQAPLRIVDSITELGAKDSGCIAVSGSHGGLSSARYAAAARPLLAVFNDAGFGKDGAGIAGLALLHSRGVAACAVGHATARIGDAHSTLDDGIISHANALAQELGVVPGQGCREAVQIVQKARRQP